MKAVQEVKNVHSPQPARRLKYVLLGGILVITFCCYHYSLGNEFTNWDDNRFISDNKYVTSFSAANLKMILFHATIKDYYIPLTLISYAINYHFSGLAPESYYLTNIIIHILNSCLMFFLVLMMLREMEKCGYGNFRWKEWMAFFCTFAFAIHPMHVESVSWIAERKDVLYAFFYFAGMMAYLKYTAKSEEPRAKNYESILFFMRSSYLLVFSFYLLSLLSKPMAVVFPFSLLMIDVLLKRDKTTTVKNIILEKLPFIGIAIVSAIATYHIQKASGAVPTQQLYSFFHRCLYAPYNFYMYIVKAFIPLPQSAYYPYPEHAGTSGSLPLIFYLSPLIAFTTVLIPTYISYRSGENNFRIVLFGLGFYFFNMMIVSQIIGSGPTIMADRYSYVCYFGIFFPVTI